MYAIATRPVLLNIFQTTNTRYHITHVRDWLPWIEVWKVNLMAGCCPMICGCKRIADLSLKCWCISTRRWILINRKPTVKTKLPTRDAFGINVIKVSLYWQHPIGEKLISYVLCIHRIGIYLGITGTVWYPNYIDLFAWYFILSWNWNALPSRKSMATLERENSISRTKPMI